ncbi:MAG TPA: alpha/beta hydrolase [Candidatus Obscuribacterales bacterium]
MYNFLHLRNGKATLNQFVASDREVVIMIRGLSRSYRSWLGLERDLSRSFDVICLDLPGVGLSHDEKPLYRVQDMALQLVEVIRALRLQRIYFVAPSLGAMVALEMTRLLPLEVVRGLVLMSPSHSGVGLKRITRRTVEVFRKSLKADQATLLELTRDLLVGRLADGRSLEEADPERLRAWEQAMLNDVQELGNKGRFAQMAAALSYTSRQALNHVRAYQIPLKCLIPDSDRMIPVDNARAVYEALKHPQSAVIELQYAGHDLIPTHAAQILDIVTQFVKEQSTYKVYPVQLLPPQLSRRRQLQNRFYTSLGLVSLGLLVFSWLLRGRSPNKQ